MTDDDPDAAALRRDLEQIKDAIGLRERYPSGFRAWLIYGLLVPLAALGSQAVVLYDLPGWGHWIAWGGFLGAGGLYLWITGTANEDGAGGAGKPNIGVQYLAIFGYAVVVLLVVSPQLPGIESAAGQATVFAIFVGAVGAAYLVVASSLEAYFIQQFDRRVFAGGGLWMLGFAVAMAWIEPLQTWGYAVFGLTYFAYAMAAYVALRRHTAETPTGEPA